MEISLYDLRKICFGGVNVLTTAVALAFKRYRYPGPLFGLDCTAALNKGLASGAITHGNEDCKVGLKGCDLLVLSDSFGEGGERLKQALDLVQPKAIILDCSSVKGHEDRVFADAGRDDVYYVGMHLVEDIPDDLTPTSVTPFFFEKRALILTPRTKQDYGAYRMLAHVLEKVGAQVIAMSPRDLHERMARTDFIPDLLDLIQLEIVLEGQSEKTVPREYLGTRLERRLKRLTSIHNSSWYDAVRGCQGPIDVLLDQMVEEIRQVKNILREDLLRERVTKLVGTADEIPEAVFDTAGGKDILVVTHGDSKVVSRIAAALADARVAIEELRPLDGDTDGGYRVVMKSLEDRERAVKALTGAGVELVTMD